MFPIRSRILPSLKKTLEVDLIDSGTEGEPIEKLYKGDGQLIIDLKQVKTPTWGLFLSHDYQPFPFLQTVINLRIYLQVGVKARDVKWLSVWCTVFQQSFGHVVF